MLMVIIMPGPLPPGDGGGVYCNKVHAPEKKVLRMVLDGNHTVMTLAARGLLS